MRVRAILISLAGAIAAGLAVMTIAPVAGELCENCACRIARPQVELQKAGGETDG